MTYMNDTPSPAQSNFKHTNHGLVSFLRLSYLLLFQNIVHLCPGKVRSMQCVL